MREVMREGIFVVEGGIGDLNKKIFKQLSNIAYVYGVEKTGGALSRINGAPPRIKVKNRKIDLNKENNLLRATIIFEVSL